MRERGRGGGMEGGWEGGREGGRERGRKRRYTAGTLYDRITWSTRQNL